MKLVIVTLGILLLISLAWAPWMDNQKVHDKVFEENAYRDGTIGKIIGLDETVRIEQICDYNVNWVPFGRSVISCEGGPYFVWFWE